MTSFQFTCPDCGREYSITAQLAGKSAQCTCGSQLVFPSNARDISLWAKNASETPINTTFQPSKRHQPPVPSARRSSPVFIPKLHGSADENWEYCSSAMTFVATCGYVAMGGAAVTGTLIAVIGIAFAYQMREQPYLSLFVLGIVTLQSLMWYFVFRLGRGLTRGEETALHGLTSVYALILAVCVRLVMLQFYLDAAIVAAGASSLFLPPIIIGYLNRNSFMAK